MYQIIGYRVLLKRIKAIKHMMVDKSVPKRKKLLIVAGIVYLFLPVDLIPPVLFPVAWMDDLVLWIWILWHLRDELDKYEATEFTGHEEDLSKKYKGKVVIDDAGYEVLKEEEEKTI